MPEIPLKHSSLIEDVRAKTKQFFEGPVTKHSYFDIRAGVPYFDMRGILIPQEDWTDFKNGLAKTDGFVGIGRDRIVISHPRSPEKVISVFHEPEDWYAMFESWVLHRSLNILFPHNFPRVYAMFGYDDMYGGDKTGSEKSNLYTGFVSERITGPTAIDLNWQQGLFSRHYDPEDFQLTYPKGSSSRIKYPFQLVLEFATRTEFPFDKLGFDPAPANFILGGDGGEYFVDMLTGPFYSKAEKYAKWWNSAALADRIESDVEVGNLQLTTPELAKMRNRLTVL